jgi:uncharacterized Fe-S cluster protein YjdI/CDGSH-type Zn-finger protein
MKGRKYTSDSIVVYYQPRLCIHAAECVRGLPGVFDTGKKPWIQPEHSSAEAIALVVARCPTGALQVERLDGGAEEAVPESVSVTFTANGPAYLRGPITLRDNQGNVLYQGTRVALCRCGASANKPFCDNSHYGTGFQAEPGRLELGDG